MGKKNGNVENGKKSSNKGYGSINSSTVDLAKERQSKPTKKAVPFYKLFRFATCFDIIILTLLILSSIAVGMAYPINIFIFKDVVNILVSPEHVEYTVALKSMIINFAILASATFICGLIQTITLSTTGQRQSRRYRHRYYSALLRQEVSWFDVQQTGQLMTKITDDIDSIESAISDKMSQFIQNISSFIGSLVIALISGWELTLAGCISVPLFTIIFFFMIHFIKKYAIAQIRAYGLAGGIAEEILSGIRTVVAFNAQEKEVQRYTSNLSQAEHFGVKKSICQGLGSGTIGFSIFSVAALVFYLGIKFVEKGEYTPGVVIQIYLTIVIGSISFSNAVPMLEYFMTAKAAAYPLFQVIDKIPVIDPNTPGIIPDSFDGDITFTDIKFEYASRAGVPILKNFNFTIPSGKTVAFIGPSGSGKSTIIHLLQRFYDPNSGRVTLNGVDLKTIDLNWYRSNIGVVQQEPPLFAGTVEENIRLGKESATTDEIVNATKDSNAYEFIMETKEQFKTQLGDMGAGFSGGQKQRIAIATALVRKPKLLLLDEATSALDNKSEKLVQKTLERAITSGRRTVVMVAHRLQTVRNADIIVVMNKGEIVEQGSHDELVDMEGLYYEMLQIQKSKEVAYKSFRSMKMSIKGEEMLYDNLDEEFPSEVIPEQVTPESKLSRVQFLKDFARIMRLNKPETCLLVVGIIASMTVGVTFPSTSLLYAQMFQVFASRNDTVKMQKDGDLFCALMLIPAFVLLIGQIFKASCMGKAGEILTTRIRSKLMGAMLRQEMAWFDKPENIPGVLTARLAQDATLVKGIAGQQLSVYLEASANVLASLVIGFYYSWMLTLLFLFFIPFITFTGIMQGKMSTNQRASASDAVKSSALIMETLNNIRTVQSLGLQNYFSDRYLQSLKSTKTGAACRMAVYGILNAFSTSALYFAYCIVFYVGAILMDEGRLEMIQLVRVFACLTVSSTTLGRALAMAPDSERARQAARRTLDTIDRVSEIEADPTKGKKPPTRLTGDIEFSNIYFRYPTRMNIPVLRGLDLKINAGETVAFVGHSGCGKSTLIQLLERYYDPLLILNNPTGHILLDGHNLTSLNLKWVRNQMGLVKQEPSLFNMTISENIAYGVELEETWSSEEIEKVARMANIHDFVTSLPEGYETKVGQRGGHLSGGQKQRICIARALFKQPPILLLDEATSALDTESEKQVQEALDRAQKNCTCLVIAHRLSTIQNADKIVVIDDGVVKEIGTHSKLMAKKGLYYELNTQHIQ